MPWVGNFGRILPDYFVVCLLHHDDRQHQVARDVRFSHGLWHGRSSGDGYAAHPLDHAINMAGLLIRATAHWLLTEASL